MLVTITVVSWHTRSCVSEVGLRVLVCVHVCLSHAPMKLDRAYCDPCMPHASSKCSQLYYASPMACDVVSLWSAFAQFPLVYSPELHFPEFTSVVADMKNSVKVRTDLCN